MADPDFLDGLVLGSVLLGAVFASVYVGIFFVPAFWILLVCGWPLVPTVRQAPVSGGPSASRTSCGMKRRRSAGYK